MRPDAAEARPRPPTRRPSRLLARLSLLLLLFGGLAQADEAHWDAGQPGEHLEIALATVGPGTLYWERFGHNAIVVRDHRDGRAVAYNFGIFDFRERNFLLRFLRGEMMYMLVPLRLERDLAQYVEAGRSVDVQWLALAPGQRLALQSALEEHARPENRRYRYDYFEQNCSTKVRDALDAALGGALRRHVEGRSRGFTYRMHALRLTAVEPWLYLGIDAGLARATDRAIDYWREMFVPMELQRHLRTLRIRDDAGAERPLVAREERLAEPRHGEPPELPPDTRLAYLLAGLLLGGIVATSATARGHRLGRWTHATVSTLLLLLAGAGGTLLLALWAFTAHRAAWGNENLLLFSPLALALLPSALAAFRAGWRPGRFSSAVATALLIGVALAFASKMLPGFPQRNLGWILFWLPVHGALAFAWRRARGV